MGKGSSLRRLFIANRGEIARRIAHSAQEMGIESCVFAAGEPPAYLRSVVDHFIAVPEETPALYLDGPGVVAKAKAAGCDAVHPGFGFLSESAAFAREVQKTGLTWVGPEPAAMEAMADKSSAREVAERCGVPVLSALALETGEVTPAELAGLVKEHGYPLLIKAAMGGGGKGMRVVWEEGQLADALQRAASEAANAFGDARLLVEPFIPKARHVEVQVLGDAAGRVIALGERDCSAQRRQQKVIEESPAPGLSAKLRAGLAAAAVRLGEEVGYRSAGTVEFLVPLGGEPDRFYFLEMNTRIQVEHPVTEEVWGLDLVAWQLRIAAGESLPAGEVPFQPRGASVEARLYAEDPSAGFLPSPGKVAAFVPALAPGVRWEVGLDPVSEIDGRFDPMIAKVVATGETREVAFYRLRRALERTVIAGVRHNRAFLVWLLAESPMTGGVVHTRWIEEEEALWKPALEPPNEVMEALAGLVPGGEPVERGGGVSARVQAIFGGTPAVAAAEGSGWQTTQRLRGAGREAEVGEWVLASGDRWPACRWRDDGGAYAQVVTPRWDVALGGEDPDRAVLAGGAAGGASGGMQSPVPGRIVAVKVAVGEAVTADTVCFVLESMKMEFTITAPGPGRIAAIAAAEGEQVVAQQTLAQWEPEAEEEP